MNNDIIYIASIFFVNFCIGFITLPFASLFFNKFSDKGYTVSSLLGWIIIAYMNFVLVTIGLLKLNLFSLLVTLGIWLCINIAIQYKYKTVDFRKLKWRQIASINIAFLLLMLFWYWVRGHNPEIYQIERFMDFGFTQALFNSESLPLYDIWFSGETLNYYYFGHFLGYVALSFGNIPTVPGFFVLVVWMFATIGVNVYRLSKDIFNYITEKKYPYIFGLASGVMGTFLVLFAGTLNSLIWVKEVFLERFFNGPPASFWYADPTRFIDGTITEMPLYSFIVADLHPHVWGIFTGILVLAVLFAMWQDVKKKVDFKNIYLYMLTFLLGIAYIINSWDALTLGILVMFTIIIKYRVYDLKNFKFNWLLLVLIPIFAYAFTLPWSFYFEAPLSGVGIVSPKSNPYQWFMIWGAFLIIISVYVFLAFLQPKLKVKTIKANVHKILILTAVTFGLLFTVLVLELVLVKEVITYKYINLLIALVQLGLFGLIGFIYFWILGNLSRKKRPEKHLFVLTILFIAVFFWVFMEIFFFQDILLDGEWFRANTVFKITTQVWLWIGTISGGVFFYLLSKLKTNLFGFIMIFILIFIISIVLIYPLKAIEQANVKGNDFKGFGNHGLDWWEEKYYYDFEAYEYLRGVLNELPEDDKVRFVVEAEGDSYEDNTFYSTFLGWPTIVGWPVHEWTWRGSYDEVGKKRDEVVEIYNGDNVDITKQILKDYDADYIVIGQTEKRLYEGTINEEKILKLGTVVFENALTKVIEIDKENL